jgi:regulator of PEP synthase PpsR (kinase-PPPase family)
LRRTSAEVAEDKFDHDIATFKAEIKELESEASHAGGEAKDKLHTKVAAAKSSLKAAVERSQQRVDALKHEADAKVEALKVQMKHVKGDMKTRIEDRVKLVKGAYHARGAKLSQAWHLTKEALAV